MIESSAQLIQVTTDSGQVLWAQFGFSSKARTPQVILTFKKDGNGQVVQYIGFLTTDKVDKGGKTPFERALDALHTVGFQGDDLDAFNDQTPHGRARISTEMDDYNDRTVEKVRFVNAEAFSMNDSDRMGTGDLKKFSAKLKAEKERAARASSFDQNGPPGGRHTSTSPDNDDINF